MYYVNRKQIEQRLQFIATILAGCEAILKSEPEMGIMRMLAQERILHLAIETVTDVGSLIIDGFLMRDASSYEDIMEILHQENVFSANTAAVLLQLVKLRKPLVQEYMNFSREQDHPLIELLPEVLPAFARSVREFISRELGG